MQAGAEKPLEFLAAEVAAHPGWIEGHAALSSLRWECGDRKGFLDSYKAALKENPQQATLWNGYIGALAGACDFAGAADAARDARRFFDVPMLRLIEASHAGMAGDLQRSASLLRTIPVDLPERLPLDVRQLLRTGRPERAEELLSGMRTRAPHDISLWALTEIIWRLLGDHRADWLSGQPNLIGILDLALTSSEITNIAGTLNQMHRASSPPIAQSVRGGTQTRGNLFDRADPAIDTFRIAIERTLADYVEALPPHDATHPLLRHREQRLRIENGWSVRLTGEGYHVPHLHPGGILSSASYLLVPEPTLATKEGWLEFGRPPSDLHLDLEPIKSIEPRPGRLVLFPSYLYHGTRPFSAGQRLTVAFDIA